MTTSTTARDVAVDAALGYLVALHTDVQDCIERSHDPAVQRFDEAYDAPLPTLQQLTALFDVRPTLTRAFCVVSSLTHHHCRQAMAMKTSEAHVCATMRLLSRGLKVRRLPSLGVRRIARV